MFLIRNRLLKTLNLKNNLNLFKRNFTEKNILALRERGFFNEIFPDNAGAQIKYLLTSNSSSIYAGFDPTADSLHIGNLLVLIGLLHCQRSGHQPIALLGGATALIGDPSGRTTERSNLITEQINFNLENIKKQIQIIFENHEEIFFNKSQSKESIKQLKILNNRDWYKEVKLIDFISTYGRHFRMGQMLSRSSVQSRLKSEAGMSFTEFTYQLFQAYDWLHLLKTNGCRFQIGGIDQMGNLMSGYELINRVENKPVYGLTLPLVTNEEGDKFGKSAGNAVWLAEDKTSPFSLYQFFIRIADSEVEKLLKLYTFLSMEEIIAIMTNHKKVPELREAQKTLARETTLLVHGVKGLRIAEATTSALYKGNIEILNQMNAAEISQTFQGAVSCNLNKTPGLSVLDVAMKAKCFPTISDATRIISAGGFYINQSKVRNIAEIITENIHIMKNNITLLRVGKKNYYIIKWL